MKYKLGWTLLGLWVIAIGCARVQVEAPKDPIKMDITMRLDVYQHVSKDIDEIEKIVSGTGNKTSLADAIIPPAHANSGLSPDAESAAYRRRDRKSQVDSFKANGVLAENSMALLELRGAGDMTATQIMQEENNDRMIIYRAIAEKNQTAVEEVQKVYSKRLN